MDDLKLSVVIEALLNAKGFEDAKAALKNVSDQATQAAPKVKGATDSVKGMGESFGGSRGPVADLTRLLLQNAGVTGAAGEAAKATGIAMHFLEGAATAANFAIAGGVAAIALLLPKLIEWATKTEDQNESQKKLLDNMKEMVPLIERYAKAAGGVADAAAVQLLAEHAKLMREEKKELEELSEKYRKLREDFDAAGKLGIKITTQGLLAATQWKARIDDLTEAQKKNLTVAEMYEKRIAALPSKVTPAVKEQTAAVEKLTLAEKMEIEQELDAGTDRITLTQRQDKAKAKAAADETQLILDRMALERADLAQARAIADEKANLVRQSAAVLASAFAGLIAAFTKNKALNIAAATADTFAAANVALKSAPPPLNFALMASVIAQGIANVHRIRTANPEGIGFDDPFSDLTARQFGRRSAQDFAKNFGGEFTASLPGEMARQTVYNHHTTINRGVTHNYGGVHGLLAGSPTAFQRGLDRAMTRASRFRRRTTQGR